MSDQRTAFLEEYNAVAYACWRECSLSEGLPDYLAAMEKKMKADARLAETWKEPYAQLQHLQHLHARLTEASTADPVSSADPISAATPISAVEIEPEDVTALTAFADSVWNGTDPLSVQCAADAEKAPKPLTSKQLFLRIAIWVIIALAIGVLICFKLF